MSCSVKSWVLQRRILKNGGIMPIVPLMRRLIWPLPWPVGLEGGFSSTLPPLIGLRLFLWPWKWLEANDIAWLSHTWRGPIVR